MRHKGSGPPLLLLHGHPQTHAMWHRVAPRLAEDFTVVCADLRGYGDSSKLPTTQDHEPYSKRAMARDMLEVMRQLGFDAFFLAGHDRGGRCAYRLALDHPERVLKLAVARHRAHRGDVAARRHGIRHDRLALVLPGAARPVSRKTSSGRTPNAFYFRSVARALSSGGARGLLKSGPQPRHHPRHVRGLPGGRDLRL